MSNSEESNEQGPPGGRFTSGSTMGYYLAAGVVVLIVAALVLILVHPATRSTATGAVTTTVLPPASGSTSAGSPASSASVPSSSTARGCSPDPSWVGQVPQSAPAVTWVPVAGLSAPVSPRLGPARVSGPSGVLRECYAHSPSGAVVAAINITVAGSVTTVGNIVVQRQWTPGPGKQEALAQQAQAGTFTIAGFQLQGCTPAQCLVSVAASSGGKYAAAQVPLVWSGGDWKVDGTVTGISSGIPLTNLTGYVLMSPAGQ